MLTDLLGYELYKLMIADLDGSGDPTAQRFKDLVDGAEFQNDYRFAQTLKWNGFRNDEKQSFIAYFMFYKYVERTHSLMSGIGNVLLKAENGERFDPYLKTTAAWSRMQELYGYIDSDYEELYPVSMRGAETSLFNELPSAYNFLYANKETYPEWVFKPKWDVTVFGL